MFDIPMDDALMIMFGCIMVYTAWHWLSKIYQRLRHISHILDYFKGIVQNEQNKGD
jgi:hypothetical protein